MPHPTKKKGRLTTIGLALCSLLAVLTASTPATDAQALSNVYMKVFEDANGTGWSRTGSSSIAGCYTIPWIDINEISSYAHVGIKGYYGVYDNNGCGAGDYILFQRTGSGVENLPSWMNDRTNSFSWESLA
jgi:hypothetical protein